MCFCKWKIQVFRTADALRSVLVLVLVSFSGLTSAGCLEDYKEVIDGLYKESSVVRSRTVCKVWPATGNLIVAASIERAENIDLDVQLFDFATNSVIGRVRELGVLTGDAIYNSGIVIDTAKYRLDEASLAFGIRISWNGASRANPYSSESLRLYISKGSELVTPLSGLTTYEYSGEWDTRCVGSFVTRKMTLVIRPRAGSYADLLVKEKVEGAILRGTESDCKDAVTERVLTTVVLRYEQDSYEVPERLRTLAW